MKSRARRLAPVRSAFCATRNVLHLISYVFRASTAMSSRQLLTMDGWISVRARSFTSAHVAVADDVAVVIRAGAGDENMRV
jgi:hypothetical protein